jgi:hypothetical protein
LVERLVRNEKVAGSIPVGSTIPRSFHTAFRFRDFMLGQNNARLARKTEFIASREQLHVSRGW